MTRTRAVAACSSCSSWLVYALMYAGWRRRARRHPSAAVADEHGRRDRRPARPTHAGAASTTPSPEELRAEGTYVSTTTVASPARAGRRGGLGVRARATMAVGPGGGPLGRQGAADGARPARAADRRGPRAGHGRQVGRPEPPAWWCTWRADDGDEFATGFLPRVTARPELVDAVESALWWRTGDAPDGTPTAAPDAAPPTAAPATPARHPAPSPPGRRPVSAVSTPSAQPTQQQSRLVDREPAVLVLEDGRTFRGESYGARRRDRRRGGLLHRHDRLPGDADRPQLPPAGRRDDRAARRQHRRQRRGRRVAPDLGRRLRRARPRAAALQLALAALAGGRPASSRASSASAASTPAR